MQPWKPCTHALMQRMYHAATCTSTPKPNPAPPHTPLHPPTPSHLLGGAPCSQTSRPLSSFGTLRHRALGCVHPPPPPSHAPRITLLCVCTGWERRPTDGVAWRGVGMGSVSWVRVARVGRVDNKRRGVALGWVCGLGEGGACRPSGQQTAWHGEMSGMSRIVGHVPGGHYSAHPAHPAHLAPLPPSLREGDACRATGVACRWMGGGDVVCTRDSVQGNTKGVRKEVGVPLVGKVLVGVQVRLAPLAWFARVTTL